ncbi:hypothetical protein [Fluviicola taffensis]|nr:hypothetical protein [Fluviicola taffensis]
MKLHISNWLSFSLFFFLIFSCKKKDDFLPLKTGKYQVDYKVLRSNGDIDNYQYTAYGPKNLALKYLFDIKLTDTTNFCNVSISYNQRKLNNFLWTICPSGTGKSLKITYYDCSEENLTIYYTSSSDTTSGTVIFNLLEE